MQIDILLFFLFSAIVLTVSPGPDIVYVFLKSSTEGVKAGFKTVLGLTTGLIFHTLLLVFGISALIESNENVFFVLKVFGFFYFLFLAGSTFFRSKKSKFTNLASTTNNFSVGLMMNLLNPKVSLFFIALFPGFLFSDSIKIEIQFLILGIIFWFVATIIFSIVVFISSKFKENIQNFLKNRNIEYLQAIVFVLVAIWIAK